MVGWGRAEALAACPAWVPRPSAVAAACPRSSTADRLHSTAATRWADLPAEATAALEGTADPAEEAMADTPVEDTAVVAAATADRATRAEEVAAGIGGGTTGSSDCAPSSTRRRAAVTARRVRSNTLSVPAPSSHTNDEKNENENDDDDSTLTKQQQQQNKEHAHPIYSLLPVALLHPINKHSLFIPHSLVALLEKGVERVGTDGEGGGELDGVI